jgi:uncharacterized protein (DUF362 family)
MRRGLKRREALAAVAGVSFAGCTRRTSARASVSIIKAATYERDLDDIVRRMLAMHQLDVRGRRVLLKPNILDFDSAGIINTNPHLVHAALEAFRAAGAAEVGIGEGPAHHRLTLDLADAAGYFSVIPDFERLFVDLNTDEVSPVRLPAPHTQIRTLYLPNSVLRADLIVSMPKMKTHRWAGVTLSSKNLFGTVPGAVYGWPKNLLHHQGIHECVADLRSVLRQTFAIVDGVECMEGYGPIRGTRKNCGVIVAGSDLTAVDATCCRIMRVDPERVKYLDLTARFGQIASELIEQRGESIAAVRSSFALAPGFEALRLLS